VIAGRVALLAAFVCVVAVTASAAEMTPSRAAREAAFLRSVKPNQTANDMTANVLAHVGEHVAYRCEIEEIERPGVVVGQCGSADEPVDLYLKLPPGTWRVGERLRVLGVMDVPASWSDAGGHTVYYPFVKAVFVDRVSALRRR